MKQNRKHTDLFILNEAEQETYRFILLMKLNRKHTDLLILNEAEQETYRFIYIQ